MSTLLVSTYDLGHQPQLAAELAPLVNDLVVIDATKQEIPLDITEYHAIVITAPMYTGAQIAREILKKWHEELAEKQVVVVGLYAQQLVKDIEDSIAATAVPVQDAEVIVGLLSGSPEFLPKTRKRRYLTDRSQLIPLSQYRKVVTGTTELLSGYVETTRGCRHRCRHCPVAPIWDGRIAINDADNVLADIAKQVAGGAKHISFGDPDFLNAPKHSIAILLAAHEMFPEIGFDVTTKISEIVAHPELIEKMARANLRFVTSAVESLNNTVLEKLGKGHTAEQVDQALKLLSSNGIGMHPTFVPFTPWTELADIANIVEWVYYNHLEDVVEPVQYSIELLLPENTLIDLSDVDIARYDPEIMGYRFNYRSPELKDIQKELAQIAASSGCSYTKAFSEIRILLTNLTGEPVAVSRPNKPQVQHYVVTEPWFCCAAPIDG